MANGADSARAARLIWIPAALMMALALSDCLAIFLLPHRVMGDIHLGLLVEYVEPGAGFDRAGIRAGDRFENDAEARRLFTDGSLYDYHGPYRITVHRGARVFRTSVDAASVGPWIAVGRDTITLQIAATFGFFVMIGLAGWLFVLRPTAMTLALFLFAANPPFYDGFALQVASPPVRVAVQALLAALSGASPWFLLIFALRFPDDRVRYWPIASQATVLTLAALSALLSIASSYIGFRLFFTEFAAVAETWFVAASLSATMVILVVKLARTRGVERAKLRWAIVGVSVPLIFSLAVIFVPPSINLGYWAALLGLPPIVLSASLAYVLTQSHFVDPRYTISRAAVWSATAAILLAGVGGVDWLTSRLLEQRRLSDAVDALAAIVLGFFLNAIHKQLESSLERIIFRAKHRASRRLRTIGSAVAFASDLGAIESAMVSDAATELHLVSAALFLRSESSGSGFQRGAAIAWTGPYTSDLDENERLVRLLKAARGAIDLREWPLDAKLYPSGLSKPRVAIPVFTRDELRAFALYSGHRDHTELDNSEIDLLNWLAEKCSAAFDHVEVCTLRALLAASWAPIGSLESPESSRTSSR